MQYKPRAPGHFRVRHSFPGMGLLYRTFSRVELSSKRNRKSSSAAVYLSPDRVNTRKFFSLLPLLSIATRRHPFGSNSKESVDPFPVWGRGLPTCIHDLPSRVPPVPRLPFVIACARCRPSDNCLTAIRFARVRRPSGVVVTYLFRLSKADRKESFAGPTIRDFRRKR